MSASLLCPQGPAALTELPAIGLSSSDLDAAGKLFISDPWLEPARLLTSSRSRGAPGGIVPALLGVSGGPGGNKCADRESSDASGRLMMLMGGGGAGNAVELLAAAPAVSSLSGEAAAT